MSLFTANTQLKCLSLCLFVVLLACPGTVSASSDERYELYNASGAVQDDSACTVTQMPERHCYYKTPAGLLSRDGWVRNGSGASKQIKLPVGSFIYPSNNSPVVFMAMPGEPDDALTSAEPDAKRLWVTTNFAACLQDDSEYYSLRGNCFQPAHYGFNSGYGAANSQIYVYDQENVRIRVTTNNSKAIIYNGLSTIFSYNIGPDTVNPSSPPLNLFATIDPAYPPTISAANTLGYSVGSPNGGPIIISGLKACYTKAQIYSFSCSAEDITGRLTDILPGFQKIVATHFDTEGLAMLAVMDVNGQLHTIGIRPKVNVPISYLGLGDSFSAGEGTFSYRQGSDTADNKCHSSLKSYSYILGAEGSVACMGARLRDFMPDAIGQFGNKKTSNWQRQRQPALFGPFTPGIVSQLDTVTFYQPAVATVSIGGNDVGFGQIMRACLIPIQNKRLSFDCFPTYEDRLELLTIIHAKFDELVKTYSALRIASPNTRFIVVGYPKLLLEEDNCRFSVRLSREEIQFANQWTEYFNATIEAASAKAGVRYVSMSDAFAGYELCGNNSRTPAVNGIVAGSDGLRVWRSPIIGQETYHPTTFGYYLMANRLRPYMSDTSLVLSDQTRRAPPITDNMPILQVPRTGRRVIKVIPEPGLVPDVINRTKTALISISDLGYALLPHADYAVRLDNQPITIAQGTVPADGRLELALTIPATVEDGAYTVHLMTTDSTGEEVDITKTVDINELEVDDSAPIPVTTGSLSLTMGSVQVRSFDK